MTRLEVVERHPDGIVTVRCPRCTYCRKDTLVNLTSDQYDRLARGGELIQSVLSQWTPADRELLMTGIHGACWKKMFPDE